MAKEAKNPRASAYLIRNKNTGEFLDMTIAGTWIWTRVIGDALQFVRYEDAGKVAARFIVQGYEVAERQT